jgi:hypothetical protein
VIALGGAAVKNMADINTTIGDLVQRSRLGDQVATATIAVVADKAKSGDRKAEKVRQQILKYCKVNPIKLDCHMSFFGVDTPVREDVTADALLLRRSLHTAQYSDKGIALLILSLGGFATGILFHGPSLFADSDGPNEIVTAARNALEGDDMRRAFDLGNRATNRPDILETKLGRMTDPQKKACHLGILIGRARRMQAVAEPGTPLSLLCMDTAWELGE